MAFPRPLADAVAGLLVERGSGSHRDGSASLTRTYRQGGTSSAVDLSAYLVSRLPATFAAVAAVLAEVARLRPGLAPVSLIDAGAGPGTASWAAVELWDSLEHLRFLDSNTEFLAIAAKLAAASPRQALRGAKTEQCDLAARSALPSADLAITAYALAELPVTAFARALRRLWAAAPTLVLVEPGTPAGFARIATARHQLLEEGAHMIGPCPHASDCPVVAPDWCHFAVRLPRSRAHMHAKAAKVPFEDEKFSWLAVSRVAGPLPAARILAPPRHGKAGVTLKLCSGEGLVNATIARREATAYKQARKLDWGGTY